MNIMSGKFITFEGIDGSGKSTQAKTLSDWLTCKNINNTVTRDPGGTDGAEAIRNMIVTGDKNRWHVEIDIMLFSTARLCNAIDIVNPALKRGDVVISDRWADSTLV